MQVTQIPVVSDLTRSTAWWVDVLGAGLYREYGGTSAVLDLAGSWVLLVTGGPPTDAWRSPRRPDDGWGRPEPIVADRDRSEACSAAT